MPYDHRNGRASECLRVKKVSEFCRDTYSDRSGSSSPDSEITELKFPSSNQD